MLKAEFVNDLRHNYMILEYEEPGNEFALKMLTENMMERFLPVELRRMDNRLFLYYDISGMQNMEVMYAEKIIDRECFKIFMWGLHEVIEQSRELFLSGNGICFEPTMIFWSLEKRRWEFVYLPERDESNMDLLREERERLAEFLVMRIDYEDKDLAETAYHFYEEVCAGRIYPEKFWEGENRKKEETDIQIKETKDWEEEISEAVQKQEVFGGKDEKESLKRQGIKRKKHIKYVFLLFLFAAVAMTLTLGRRYRDFMIPGGILSIIFAGAFLCIQMKQQEYDADERLSNTTEERGLEENSFVEEAMGLEEFPIEEKEGEACSEKTVYIDIQKEQEKKLYGMGKFRQKKISLEKLPYMIGKDESLVNGVISDSSVSRIHARFFMENEELYMQDLNSTNGTYHNGLRLKPNEAVLLEPEDEVSFGRVGFVYR